MKESVEVLQSNAIFRLKPSKTCLKIGTFKSQFSAKNLVFQLHKLKIVCKPSRKKTPSSYRKKHGFRSAVSLKLNVFAFQLDRSPLHIAAERGHTSIVELLVDKFKASVAARTKVKNTGFQLFLGVLGSTVQTSDQVNILLPPPPPSAVGGGGGGGRKRMLT